MSETQASSGNGKPFDPVASWRDMRDNYLDAWAKAMIGVVNTEAYARNTGAMLDTMLAVSAPLRESMHDMMTQALANLSMPSRGEVVSLAERMTQVEMRLDDMDAKLDRIAALLAQPAAPRKTRKKGA